MRGALYRGNLGESQTASGEEYIPSSSKDLVFTGNHAQRAPGTSCRISKSQRELTIVVVEGLEATLVNGGRQRCSTVNYSSVYEVQPPPRHRPVQPTPSYSASFGQITVSLFPSCYCVRQRSAAEQDYDSEDGTSILCTVSYPHYQWILRDDYTRCTVWKWHLLVRVCQRWRQIAFASPHRLNLQILCTYRTPVRKNLGIWSALSIVVDYAYSGRGITTSDEDNVIAALEHSDRVCYLVLNITGSQLGNMVTVMQEPFTVLTHLSIFSGDGNASVLPAGFLGGSAPCLQTIHLRGIPFPTLPTVLLSANDLITLKLHAIPSTGYISPEAMVASLAALPRLETLIIEFQSATPRPDRIRPPPVTRTGLTALISFL